jgi:hypothetical protein
MVLSDRVISRELHSLRSAFFRGAPEGGFFVLAHEAGIYGICTETGNILRTFAAPPGR